MVPYQPHSSFRDLQRTRDGSDDDVCTGLRPLTWSFTTLTYLDPCMQGNHLSFDQLRRTRDGSEDAQAVSMLKMRFLRVSHELTVGGFVLFLHRVLSLSKNCDVLGTALNLKAWYVVSPMHIEPRSTPHHILSVIFSISERGDPLRQS